MSDSPLSLSFGDEVHAWQSPMVSDEEEERSLCPRRLEFLLKEKHEDWIMAVEAMKQLESFQFNGTKNADGTAKQRCVELSEIADHQAKIASKWLEGFQYYAEHPHEHPNRHIDTHAFKMHLVELCEKFSIIEDALKKLAHTLKTPSNMSCMYVANISCSILQGVLCNNEKGHYVLGLAWYFAKHKSMFNFLFEDAYLNGLRLSVKWVLHCFEKGGIMVPAPPALDAVNPDHVCIICQSPLKDSKKAVGIQRRCDSYPFSKNDDHCIGHRCACPKAVFHVECLATSFYHDREARFTYSKCPLCNAHYCLSDLIEYQVGDYKKRKIEDL